jgi:hypothetical protein
LDASRRGWASGPFRALFLVRDILRSWSSWFEEVGSLMLDGKTEKLEDELENEFESHS